MPAKPSPEELEEQVRRLEAENARLKQINAGLQPGGEKPEKLPEKLPETVYERILKSTLEAVDSLLVVIDRHHRIVFCNWKDHEWVPIAERENAPLCYQVLKNLDAPCANCPPLESFADGRARWYEDRNPVDGSCKEISVAPIFDDTGAVAYVLENVRDVSGRKRAEEVLRESEEQKNLILNATAEMVAYYDRDLRIIWANRAAADSVGSTPEALAGRHCYEVWHQAEAPCTGCPLLEVKNTGVPQHGEMQTPDGRSWFVRGYPVFDDKGDVAALVEFTQDISEQKQAELEKTRLEAQVNQAQKLESIGRLAGGVAHDLNNMLSPILGYGEMLLDEAGCSNLRREPLEEIISAGERARSLVRQLLAFSRRQALHFQSIDINELVENFAKLLRRTIREDIAIHTSLAGAVAPVEGDVGQLEQVVMNLAVNAQDAMPKGGELRIETAEAELDEAYAAGREGVTPGRYVMLRISDNGLGMDTQTSARIFEPFFTTKEKEQGTGLGLATVYGIIKQHGGNIWIYSEPGVGTTFKIYLPVSKKAPHPRKDRVQGARTPQGGFETILLAEDSQQVRELAHTVLERQGYHVLAAESGQQALELLESHESPLHLLLTDVIMPDMDGQQLFAQIAAARPETRVLFMSGYTDNILAGDGAIDPQKNFLQKPFSVKDLSAKVREILDQKT